MPRNFITEHLTNGMKVSDSLWKNSDTYLLKHKHKIVLVMFMQWKEKRTGKQKKEDRLYLN